MVVVWACRLAVLPGLGLFNDEAYYWEWSRRLGASYYDHPPAVAWLLAASTALLGRTLLAVHLPAFLLSAATAAVLHRLTLDVLPGRRDVAWWAVALCSAAPLFGLGAVFTTPDAPAMLLWVVTAWLAWRAVTRSPALWYVAGITAGLGLLSKYTFALLPPGVLLFLLHPRHRHWLRRREPWIAAATMLALFLPVVAWNAEHDWASFRFHLVERHTGSFRPWKTLGRFLVAQQSLSPLAWVAALVGLVRGARRARTGSDAHRFLVACALPILAFFALAALFTYVNPNWFALGFLTALVVAAEVVVGLRSPWARAAPAALAAALTLLFYLQARTLVLPLPPRTDFATDLNGWEDVGARLRALRSAAPRPDRTFVASRRFQLSALAAFHVGDGIDVTRLGGGKRDQYDFWGPPGGRRGQDAIWFCDDQKFAPPDARLFAACDRAADLPIVRSGRTVRTFSFWTCRGYSPP